MNFKKRGPYMRTNLGVLAPIERASTCLSRGVRGHAPLENVDSELQSGACWALKKKKYILKKYISQVTKAKALKIKQNPDCKIPSDRLCLKKKTDKRGAAAPSAPPLNPPLN